MTDYEIVRVANIGNPMIGKPVLTVSTNKVGIQYEVLMALGKPEYFIIRKGVRSNAGTLVIEAVEERADGSIFVDYNRKKLAFYDMSFVELCKSLVKEYSKGTFYPGVFYCIRGEQQENTVIFDFHKATMRFVKGRGKYEAKGKAQRKTAAPAKGAGSMSVKGRRTADSPLAGYELL